ncbi:MAG: helix-turn-helix transcriptional regulator [Oscillospiraceae bacterium]|nr:helix-turn-helix transcriptional regulator [Oscillospiraceae bacterium]
MTFSEKLSAARKTKGFSQEELAAKIEVSRQAISKWENGTAQPETANILKLCEVLEISPNELFGFEEKSPVPEAKTENKARKKFFIITAIIILFCAYLFWVGENRPFYYVQKDLPIPVTDCQYRILPEESDEKFLAVEMTVSFENVKSWQTFEIMIRPGGVQTENTVETFPAVKIGPSYDKCVAVIKLPIGGNADTYVVSKEGSRISRKNIGCFFEITEDSCVFKINDRE